LRGGPRGRNHLQSRSSPPKDTDRLRDAGEVNAALMAEVTALHAGENSPARLLIS
jgi:hypothetical protein